MGKVYYVTLDLCLVFCATVLTFNFLCEEKRGLLSPKLFSKLRILKNFKLEIVFYKKTFCTRFRNFISHKFQKPISLVHI